MQQQEQYQRKILSVILVALVTILSLIVILSMMMKGASSSPSTFSLKVMTFNIEGGGPFRNLSYEVVISTINGTGADVVGLQETRLEDEEGNPTSPSCAPIIAQTLGWYLYEPDLPPTHPAFWANAVISKYPIARHSPGKLGCEIVLPWQQEEGGENASIYLFNVHLSDVPYQPYQIYGVDYGDNAPNVTTEKEAIYWARKARRDGVNAVIDDVASADTSEALAIFITGDFNEPSHLDWTERAARAGLHPFKVAYPSTLALERKGFVDTFRAVNRDEVAVPGNSWSAYPQPYTKQIDDRIDYVLMKGTSTSSASVVGVDLVGDSRWDPKTPFPSDHRGVVADISFRRL